MVAAAQAPGGLGGEGGADVFAGPQIGPCVWLFRAGLQAGWVRQQAPLERGPRSHGPPSSRDLLQLHRSPDFVGLQTATPPHEPSGFGPFAHGFCHCPPLPQRNAKLGRL